MAELTPKQKRFVDEYLVDLNATQAAIRAGYSEKTAEQMAYKLVQKSLVQEAIQKRIEERGKRTEITQDAVLKELQKIAFSSGADFARVAVRDVPETVVDEETGEFVRVVRQHQLVELVDTDELSQEKQAAIAGIKQTKHGIEVSSYDKVKALELLGRHLGMFTDKLDLNVPVTIVIEDDYGD